MLYPTDVLSVTENYFKIFYMFLWGLFVIAIQLSVVLVLITVVRGVVPPELPAEIGRSTCIY